MTVLGVGHQPTHNSSQVLSNHTETRRSNTADVRGASLLKFIKRHLDKTIFDMKRYGYRKLQIVGDLSGLKG